MMLMGDTPISLRLEQWRPGIGRRLFSARETLPMPAWPGTVLRRLSLPRLESLLDGMALAGVVPSCARAVRSRQLAYLAGRLCAEAALHALTGRCYVVGQRPDGAPCWPAGVLGSIAHDAHGALAVVAHCRDYRWLGIDVEPVLDEPACQAVRDVCLTAHERELLMASSWPTEEATVRFSAKEAYYKAVYPVLGGQMDFLDVELAPLTPGCPQFRVIPATSPAWRADLPVLAGHFVFDGGRVFTGIAG